MQRILSILSIFVLASLAWAFSNRNEVITAYSIKGTLNIGEAIKQIPDGTPPRKEMEYKYLLEGDSGLLSNNAYLLEVMKRSLNDALMNELPWKAPKYTNSSYSLCQIGLGTFCFLDICFDTPEMLNEKRNITHRVRYRWHSKGAFIRYLIGDDGPENYPHRCEYHVKSDRDEDVDGFYCSDETRFEFRNESMPFMRDNSAPGPPWPFEEYLFPAINGKFRNFFEYPTYVYATHLASTDPDLKQVELSSKLISVMTRRRIHLELPNLWGQKAGQMGMGSVSNAAQVMLITLDTAEIYPPDILNLYFIARAAKASNCFSKRLMRRLKDQIKPIGAFSEVEFEFERNVESALHAEMKSATATEDTANLKEIESAFCDDQRLLSQTVRSALEKIGLKATPTNISKYRKGLQILRNSKLQ